MYDLNEHFEAADAFVGHYDARVELEDHLHITMLKPIARYLPWRFLFCEKHHPLRDDYASVVFGAW